MKKTILIALLATLSLSVKAQIQKDTTNSDWKYSTTVDEMTSKKSFYADLYSPPSTDYNIIGNITVRYKKGQNEVLFSINKDLMDAGVYGLTILVKFDDGKIEKFSGTSGNGSQFTLIFIHSGSKFLKELKASKNVLIEVPIYDKGNEVFKFDTVGLIWDYK